MPRRPFDMLRAVFWLLAVMMFVMLAGSLLAGILCWVINYKYAHQVQACQEVGGMIRELWGELITGILALLLAARNPPPPPPPPDPPPQT